MREPGDTGPMDGKRPTGITVPFIGQPPRGVCGLAMITTADTSLQAPNDNRFGSRRNIPGAMRHATRIAPD
jgi:hypothetical protein